MNLNCCDYGITNYYFIFCIDRVGFGMVVFIKKHSKKHDKHLLEMEWELNTYEKFTDKCLDRIVNINIELDEIKKAIQATDTVVSKMADELFKMNDLYKRISVLENNKNIPPNIYGSTCCDGTHCTNPFHDCINCPYMFGSGGTITTTNVGTKSTDE